MMTQASGDWSVFEQIFGDDWDGFTYAHPRYQTSYYEGLVAKMLACGNPEQIGYIAYRCLRLPGHPSGGDELHIVVVLAVRQSLRRQLGQPGEKSPPRRGDLSV